MCSNIFSIFRKLKIITFLQWCKTAEGKNGREILTPYFWTFFWTFKNVHFALCAWEF